MDARRCAWEDRRRCSRNHLERWNHEKQARYDRKARRNRDQGEQEHDDAERALVQAAHQPAEREAVSRDFIVQPLQENGSYNKRSGVTRLLTRLEQTS